MLIWMRKMREADLIIENDDKGEPGGRALPSYLVLQVGNLQMVQEHSLKRERERARKTSVCRFWGSSQPGNF